MGLETIVRIGGAALIVIGCTLFGSAYGKQYRERVAYLTDFQKRLEILKNEIAFFKGLLADNLQRVAEFAGPAQALFQNMQTRLTEDQPVDTDDAWQEACELSFKQLNLTTEEADAIRALGRLLGASDVEGQLSNIEAIQAQVQMLTENAEAARRKNEPMWQRIGPVVGAAIAIFLW